MSRTRALSLLSVLVLCGAGTAAAQKVDVDADLSQSVVLIEQKQTAYIRVAMTGFEREAETDRPPVNVALVLDKSGSMGGEKIRHAKEAAVMALERLRRDDILSVVAYDDTVSVRVPATKLSDKESVADAIRSIDAGGSTALFAGVSRGADELRKFLDKERVNRVILLSDGLANVGPSAPSDLAELGESLIREGISVTTIGLGLGYNEDLMTQLALKSDGNHMFAETPRDLARTFDAEFGDVLAVVAQDVKVQINFADGVRPVRGLGREVDIAGSRATARLNQLYSGQMKYVLIEVELPAYPRDYLSRSSLTPIADVEVSYANMQTDERDRTRKQIAVRVTDRARDAEESIDADIMASVVEQIGLERNRWALQLRDEGKLDEARRVLDENIDYLSSNALRFDNERLRRQSTDNRVHFENLAPEKWEYGRKLMREDQYKVQQQQKLGQ